MRPERRQKGLLALLAALLAVAVYLQWPRTGESVRGSSSGRAQTRATGAPAGISAPDVHLEVLDAERNLFRFRAKPVPQAPERLPAVTPPSVVAPSGPPPPPAIPPIPLKFIGLLETDNAQKIAVLTDGRGAPLYGKEGDTVLGQYKILRIGAESIEMTYLDGRGRQTIRLSGS
jgi:hypothetical protein